MGPCPRVRLAPSRTHGSGRSRRRAADTAGPGPAPAAPPKKQRAAGFAPNFWVLEGRVWSMRRESELLETGVCGKWVRVAVGSRFHSRVPVLAA